MKLRLETRHRLLLIATGSDASDIEDQGDEDEATPAVAGTGGSADLTATDRPLRPTEPDARRRRGAIGFTDHRPPTA